MNGNNIYSKKKLLRASAWRRVVSRFLDAIVVGIVILVVFYLFLLKEFNVFMFLGAVLISSIFVNLYFILSLYLFGQTLFMLVFKIKIYNDKNLKTNFLIKILRREFFLIITYQILFIVLAIIFCIIGNVDSLKFIKFIFNNNKLILIDGVPHPSDKIPMPIKIGAYFYSAFSFFLFFIILFILGLTILKSKKKTWIDIISGLNTLSTIEIEKSEKIDYSKEILVDMPGVFDYNEINIEEDK